MIAYSALTRGLIRRTWWLLVLARDPWVTVMFSLLTAGLSLWDDLTPAQWCHFSRSENDCHPLHLFCFAAPTQPGTGTNLAPGSYLKVLVLRCQLLRGFQVLRVETSGPDGERPSPYYLLTPPHPGRSHFISWAQANNTDSLIHCVCCGGWNPGFGVLASALPHPTAS